MLFNRGILISILILSLLSSFSCSRKDNNITYKIELKNGINNVYNYKPLYSESEFIYLEKLHSIELLSDKYEISQATDMVVDNENNLYVLSQFESTVTVFDDSGKYIRNMGRHGEGPQDLFRPNRMSFYENKLYIFQSPSSIKIWDTKGEYIDRIIITLGNYFLIKPIKDSFLVLSFIATVDNRKIHNWSFSKTSINFKDKNVLLKYEKNRDTEFKYSPESVLTISKNNQFYFPEKSDIYSIIKYDLSGKPILSFGRKYKSIPFSKEARMYYQKLFGESVQAGRLSDLPKYPPVIRIVFLDSQGNVWVVSGEINHDLDENGIESTVDIFNEDGIWLYTFKFNDISYQSFIKNDRFYNVTKISPDTGQQYINVFKIHYNY